MDPDFYFPLTIITFGIALTALLMVLRAFTRHGASVDEISELHRAIAELREENEAMRESHHADIQEIEERIDFAERLLAQSSTQPRIEGEVVTPV